MGPFSTGAFSISLQEENESIESSALDTLEHPLLFVVRTRVRVRTGAGVRGAGVIGAGVTGTGATQEQV